MSFLAIGSRYALDIILADIHIIDTHDVVFSFLAGTEEHFRAIGEAACIFDGIVCNRCLVHCAQHCQFACIADIHSSSLHPYLCSTFCNSCDNTIIDGSYRWVGCTPFECFIHCVCRCHSSGEGGILSCAECEFSRINSHFFDHHIGDSALVETIECDSLHVTICVVEREAW